MYATIRASVSKLIENLRTFLNFLSGLDDPRGHYLFGLEARVQHLEAEVNTLRSLLGKTRGSVRERQ
jgi:hypothetical protein